jgi:hypothetical protein
MAFETKRFATALMAAGRLVVYGLVNHLYTRSVPPDGVTNDGLVAVYSAQSPVLGFQSASWQPGLTFEISHHELVLSAAVFEELGKLIASW